MLLAVLRGPVVLAAASALVLAVAAYRAAETLHPNRPDWAWGQRAEPPVEYEGRMGTLAALVDPQGRDPDSPARLQRWFREVAGPHRPHHGADPASSSPLGDYLLGPPRRLTRAEVERLLTELDPR